MQLLSNFMLLLLWLTNGCDLFTKSEHFNGKVLTRDVDSSCWDPALNPVGLGARCFVECIQGDIGEEAWICHQGQWVLMENELSCDLCVTSSKLSPCDVPDGCPQPANCGVSLLPPPTTETPSSPPTVLLEEDAINDWPTVLGLGLALVITVISYICVLRIFPLPDNKVARRRTTIVFEIILFILVVFFIMKEKELVKGLLMDLRSRLANVHLAIILVLYAVLQLIRFVIPPIYFCFPLDTAFKMVMLVKVSVYEGVLIWQTLTCFISLVGYFILKHYYKDITKSILQADSSYFEDFVAAISVIDEHWSKRFKLDGQCWQALYITSFFNTEFFSSYIGLYWLATRAQIKRWLFTCTILESDTVFCICCVVGFVLEFPAEVVQFHIIKGAIDSYEKSEFQVFEDIQVYEVVLYVLFTGVATLTVHSQNAMAVYEKVKERLQELYRGSSKKAASLGKQTDLSGGHGCPTSPDSNGDIHLDVL